MKEHVKSTMRAEVLGGLGGFSGAFSLVGIKEMQELYFYRNRQVDKLKTCLYYG